MELEQEPVKNRKKLSSLTAEIVHDVQQLFEQQVSLVKLQFIEDWGALGPLMACVAVCLVALVTAAVFSALTLAYGLHDGIGLPLWACFGIVDIAILFLGGISFLIARGRMKELSFLE